MLKANSRIPTLKSRIPKNKFRIPRDCFASLAMTAILNEIASVALLPRNDGFLEFFVMSSPPQSSWGMTQGLGILEYLNDINAKSP